MCSNKSINKHTHKLCFTCISIDLALKKKNRTNIELAAHVKDVYTIQQRFYQFSLRKLCKRGRFTEFRERPEIRQKIRDNQREKNVEEYSQRQSGGRIQNLLI